MTDQSQQFPQFYISADTPCPYLEGQSERKIFTVLSGFDASALYEGLNSTGFRRSYNVAYRPACENCHACISVRVRAQEFTLSKSMRRIMKTNADIKRKIVDAGSNEDHYRLLQRYLRSRHHDGSMAEMTYQEYCMMVEKSPIATMMVEYRTVLEDKLIAVALTDSLNDGASMVYSFFDPDEAQRSMGNYIILDHILNTKDKGLPFVYLGYWIKDSRKMAYKARFKPLDRLSSEGWLPMEDES